MSLSTVGADVVRPNVLRSSVAPNTLSGLAQAASPVRRSTTRLVLALAASGTAVVVIRTVLGR